MEATAQLWKWKSSAIHDRVLVAKTMILSKLWYYGSIMPINKEVLAKMEKIVMSYIWNGKPAKICRAQMRKDKNNGGFNVWDLEAKVRALQANWVLKCIQGNLGGSLYELIDELIMKWALAGNKRHFLNDPDDNR